MPLRLIFFFFFNDTATTEIYTLSLHDALPISSVTSLFPYRARTVPLAVAPTSLLAGHPSATARMSSNSIFLYFSALMMRSEEHTSELQSLAYLVCRLLLEKKKKT